MTILHSAWKSAEPSEAATCVPRSDWPVQRILFLLAGTFTLATAVLAVTVSPWFLVFTGLVGANQLLMVAAGWCPMSLLLTWLRARN